MVLIHLLNVIRNGWEVARLRTFKGLAKPERSEAGQGLVEYALILVLVAVVVIIIMALAGDIIAAWFAMITVCVRSPGDTCLAARALMESGDYPGVVTLMETLFP